MSTFFSTFGLVDFFEFENLERLINLIPIHTAPQVINFEGQSSIIYNIGIQ